MELGHMIFKMANVVEVTIWRMSHVYEINLGLKCLSLRLEGCFKNVKSPWSEERVESCEERCQMCEERCQRCELTHHQVHLCVKGLLTPSKKH